MTVSSVRAFAPAAAAAAVVAAALGCWRAAHDAEEPAGAAHALHAPHVAAAISETIVDPGPSWASLGSAGGAGDSRAASAKAPDLSGLPELLVGFYRSRHRAYLFGAGGAQQAPSGISASVQPWKRFADALRDDPVAVRETLKWMGAQSRPEAYIALSAFWGSLVEQGAAPELDDDELHALKSALAGWPLPSTPGELAALSQLQTIPQAVLLDFRQRLAAWPDASASLLAAIHASQNAEHAKTLVALADEGTIWRAALSDPRGGTGPGRQVAIDTVVNQPDAQWIDRLLAYASSSPSDLLNEAAAEWARRQLSGDRLAFLEERARAGAFTGTAERLLPLLLANAEDRNGAAEVAARLGVPLARTPS